MKRNLAFLVAALLMVGCLAGCGAASEPSQDNNASGAISQAEGEQDSSASGTLSQTEEETVKQFLTSIYTTDQNNRYTDYTEATENVTDETALAEAAEQYDEELAAMATEELWETMLANRVPYKYDEANIETPVSVKDIALTYSEGSDQTHFQVTVQHDDGSEESHEGTVDLDESGLVDHFQEQS